MHLRPQVAGAAQQLAPYMLPSVVMAIPAMPTTVRGKLNRKALPEPTVSIQIDDGEFVPAHSDTERAIEQIWQQVLQCTNPLSMGADFVTLGGNSLLAGRATSLLRKVLKVPLPGTAMYTHPTVAKLAELVDSLGKANDREENNAPAEPLKYKGFSSTAPSVILIQALGSMFNIVYGDFANVPGYFALYWVFITYGLTMTLYAIPLVQLFTQAIVCGIAIFLKHTLLGKVEPGRYPVYGGFYLRWWFVRQVVQGAAGMVQGCWGSTEVLCMFYRAMGATIGNDVSIDSSVKMFDADLIEIGDQTCLERATRVVPHAIENGELILVPIKIGFNSRIRVRAYVAGGAVVPDGVSVEPLSTASAFTNSYTVASPSTPPDPQHRLRLGVGIPCLMLMSTLAHIPVFIFLTVWWGMVQSMCPATCQQLVFMIPLPWIARLVLCDSYFLLAVAVKHLIVGEFLEGPRSHSTWDNFRRWLLENIVGNALFKGAMEPWINTELLCQKYRMMGCTIGSRVNIDCFEVVEFDLVTVGDEVSVLLL